MGRYLFWFGASAEEADPALVASDQAASRLAPTGVDPLRDDFKIAFDADCRRCSTEAGAIFRVRMFLCPLCGNKRCPKATDHRLDCTGSNEPGQAGSDYA